VPVIKNLEQGKGVEPLDEQLDRLWHGAEQHARTVDQVPEVFPAMLGLDFALPISLDSAGHPGSCPQSAIGRLSIEGLFQSGLLFWRQDERPARIVVASIA
jgi:hypothetical protein